MAKLEIKIEPVMDVAGCTNASSIFGEDLAQSEESIYISLKRTDIRIFIEIDYEKEDVVAKNNLEDMTDEAIERFFVKNCVRLEDVVPAIEEAILEVGFFESIDTLNVIKLNIQRREDYESDNYGSFVFEILTE